MDGESKSKAKLHMIGCGRRRRPVMPLPLNQLVFVLGSSIYDFKTEILAEMLG